MTLNVKRYCLTIAAAIIGFYVLDFLLASFGVALPGGMSVYLPPLIAAMLEGQRHARETGVPLAKGEAWRVARPMTLWAVLVQLVFAVLTLLVLMVLGGGAVLTSLAQLSPLAWIFVVLVLIVLTFLFNRLGLGFGVKGELRAMSKAK